MEIDFWSNEADIYTKVFDKTYEATTRFIVSVGGAGSSKSYSEAQKEIILSFEEHGGNVLVVRQTYASLADSCFALLKGIIYDWGLEEFFNITKNPMAITNNTTGKTFIFRGLDDIEKVKSIANIQRCWVEEANEISFKNFRELNRRIRGFDRIQITLLLNPVNEQHWIKEHFEDGKYADKTTLIRSTYKDNKFVGKEYGEELEALKDIDINDYNIYALGLWGTFSEGLIFKGWKTVQYGEIPKDLPHWYGLDFGFTNDPTAITRITYDRKNRIVYLYEVAYETGLDNKQIGKRLKADHITVYTTIYNDGKIDIHVMDGLVFVNDSNISIKEVWRNEELLIDMLKKHNFTGDKDSICISIDSMQKMGTPVYCDAAEPKSIYELQEYGIWGACRATKGKDSILTGIGLIKRLDVRVTRNSSNIIKEKNTYSWLKNKDTDKYINTPEDANNHSIDSIRYGIFTHFKLQGYEV